MVDKYPENSMYVLEVTRSTSNDYILIEKCFNEIMFNGHELNPTEIHRCVRGGETSEQTSGKLMLFHGTNRKNTVGILEEGINFSLHHYE